MRYLNLATMALFGMTTMSALAQTPSGMNPATGARPGHEPGVGVSLPLSPCAANLAVIGEDSTANDYLHAARASLVAGQICEARQALDMAETRALNRSVVRGQEAVPNNGQLVSRIRDARSALGTGNNARAIQLVDLALAS
jgi:hypothetical protein